MEPAERRTAEERAHRRARWLKRTAERRVEASHEGRDRHARMLKQAGKLAVAGAVVAVVLAECAVGASSSLRRTASAVPVIMDRTETLQPPDKTPGIKVTIRTRYAFAVGGRMFEGIATRSRDARDPRVCYDPANPGGNHSLEDGSFACGSIQPLNLGDA
jgi:hypothetical protein